MVKYKKILFFLLFVGVTLSLHAKELDFPINEYTIADQQFDKGLVLSVTINYTTKIQLENVPQVGYLEVYSILGVKVTSVNLRDCVGGCYIDLPKGLYILKAGKSAQKVIVR